MADAGGDGIATRSKRRGSATVKTLAIAATTLTAVVAVGFAVEAASLGRPDPATLGIARLVAKLEQFHGSRAVITLDGRRTGSVCTQRFDGRSREASVTLTDGQKLAELGNNLQNTGPVAEAEFFLTGCPRPLLKWIINQLNQGRRTQIALVRFDGLRLYRLRFQAAILNLELFTVRPGDLPVALRLTRNGVHGTSRVIYGAATPVDTAAAITRAGTGRSKAREHPSGVS